MDDAVKKTPLPSIEDQDILDVNAIDRMTKPQISSVYSTIGQSSLHPKYIGQ